ncbi:MAG: response regulator, partial [Deltaproteobacteria bacterium]|nr:response regulator [Deltaproteobacteria bacterium]
GKFVVDALSLTDLVDVMSQILNVSISKKAVLKYNFADNLPAVKADATQMRQIIMNLITNASEAIGDKSGVISISTGAMECDRRYLSETYLDNELPEGIYSYFEVADSGCGMSTETKQKLFDPFYTTKFTGRGLGMSAVLGIVRGHKGVIKVYSELNKGTTFKVLFPSAEEPANNIKAAAEKEAGQWQGSGTILIVDDEETVLAVGRRYLEKRGFSVLTALDGREGVEVFQEHAAEIVCVILDLTMPHMDGEETFREIRRIKGDTRIIMSSGYNEQDITQRFVGKGLAGFIQKPYLSKNLWKKLQEVLEG